MGAVNEGYRPVDCARSHLAETIHVGTLPDIGSAGTFRPPERPPARTPVIRGPGLRPLPHRSAGGASAEPTAFRRRSFFGHQWTEVTGVIRKLECRSAFCT